MFAAAEKAQTRKALLRQEAVAASVSTAPGPCATDAWAAFEGGLTNVTIPVPENGSLAQIQRVQMPSSPSAVEQKAGRNDLNTDAWRSGFESLLSQGAQVSDAVTSSRTSHGGFLVRGLSATKTIPNYTVIMSVPWNLILHGGVVHELDNIEFSPGPCTHMGDSNRFLEILALAIETERGKASKWSAYISSLPTMSDYKSYHPSTIGESLSQAFISLPFVGAVLEMKKRTEMQSACLQEIQAYTQESPLKHLIENISPEAFELASLRYSSRCYGSGDKDNNSYMVPITDMFNTAPRDDINVAWSFDEEGFKSTTYNTINAGGELYEAYCSECNNEIMMMNWGIFLEDSLDTQEDENRPAFAANFPLSCTGELREQVVSVLRSMDPGEFLAPRCKDEVFLHEDQGALKCNLARLAYQQCSPGWFDSWDQQNKGTLTSQIDGFQTVAMRSFIELESTVIRDPLGGQEGLRKTIDLIQRSGINGVHPMLKLHGLRAGAEMIS
jgi:hypothetical protein